jgi:hypothetical protein
MVHPIRDRLESLTDAHVPRTQLVGHGHERPRHGRHEEMQGGPLFLVLVLVDIYDQGIVFVMNADYHRKNACRDNRQ